MVITEQNWEEVCAGLLADPEIVKSFTPSELFELSRYPARAHLPEVRWAVVRLVHDHPDATEEDRIYVEVIRGDVRRREKRANAPAEALDILIPLEPATMYVQAERLQALGQCYFALGDLKSALAVQGSLIQLLDTDGASVIPVDLKAYYISAFLSMQLRAGVIDEGLLKKARQLLEATPEGGAKQYSLGMIEQCAGRVAFANGDYQNAQGHFLALFEIAISLRSKVVAVIEWLHTTWQINGSNYNQAVQDMLRFVMENREALQADDIKFLQPMYDEVMNRGQQISS